MSVTRTGAAVVRTTRSFASQTPAAHSPQVTLATLNEQPEFQLPKPRLGFVGTGVMGAAISKNLLADGYDLSIYNRSNSDRFQELVDLGATPASSPAEAAERSDVIFTMVGTPVDVESVVAGPTGTLAGLSTGGMTVDMTTSCPTLAIRLAELAAEQGKSSIDAPVTGGDIGARNGTLSIFLGGNATDCQLLEPVLDSMATTVNRFGDAGAGQQAKLANQIGIASQVIAMAESMAYAHKAGVDLAVWLPAVASGGAGSFSMTNYAPRIMRRDFDPGFFVDHFIKDMGLALDQCTKMGLSLPGLALCQSLFLALRAQGHGAKGIQAIVLALEEINRITLPTADVIMPSPAAPTPAPAPAPKRVINLSAGPATLDYSAMKEAATNFLSYKNSGMSMMEMSHRDAGGPVQNAIQNASDSVRDLLEVPGDYHVLWMQGGAHAQFAATIMNTLGDKKSVDVVQSGYWSERFKLSEAERYCDVGVAWSGEGYGYTRHAPVSEWNVNPDSAFVHVCLNETVQGVEYHYDPKLPGTPGDGSPFLVCDATSTLMSRPMDIENYGIVFASAGKNLGPAGSTCVIVKDSLLGNAADVCPSVLNYTKQAASLPISSIYNTPPTYNLYMTSLVLAEYQKRGGLEKIQQNGLDRSQRIYDIIDQSNGLFSNGVEHESRSRMTIPFQISDGADPALAAEFQRAGAEAGIEQLLLHPLFPGLRITMYNGLADSDFDVVEGFMQKFVTDHSTFTVPASVTSPAVAMR